MRKVVQMLRLFWLNSVLGSYLMPRPLRCLLLRWSGLDVHGAVNAHCWFSGNKVTIGAGSFVNFGVFFDSAAPIKLGRNVAVGPGGRFVTSTHKVGPCSRRAGANTAAPIRVGDGCWIGAGVTVLPGVKVGGGCVVAAGAVVTSDCYPDGVYAGVPARRVREL